MTVHRPRRNKLPDGPCADLLTVLLVPILLLTVLLVTGSVAAQSELRGTVVSIDIESSQFVAAVEKLENDGVDLDFSEVVVIVDGETRFDGAPDGPEGLVHLSRGVEVEVDGTLADGGSLLADDVELDDDDDLEDHDDHDCDDDNRQTGSATFSLGSVEVSSGDEFLVPFRVHSTSSVSLVTWSVEYNAAAFDALGPELAPGAEEFVEDDFDDEYFEWYANADEGWIQIALVFDDDGHRGLAIPAAEPLTIAFLRFRARPTAEEGDHPLIFTQDETAGYESVFRNGDVSVYNVTRVIGTPFDSNDAYEVAERAATENGFVTVQSIIGEVGILVRGDANSDQVVDISDPSYILGFLFLGGERPQCVETADVDLDGRIDITDPVIILGYLFGGDSSWAPSEFQVPLQGPCVP